MIGLMVFWFYILEAESSMYGGLENARLHTLGEEELQLQLALAMSKEEADNKEAKKRSDDLHVQMAINESKEAKEKRSEAADGINESKER